MSNSHPPFRGTRLDLVVAFDFGSTCSAASYSILEPGIIPEISSVNRFEGQDERNTKVPSLVYYDAQGNFRAAGALNSSKLALQAQAEHWIEVVWLKLLFRPNDGVTQDAELPAVAIPNGKIPAEVLGDYLRYLATATKAHIIRSRVDGEEIWMTVKERIVYVLCYPNGWKDSECSQLLAASLHGELIPNVESARKRLHFVSEGEASFHWCLMNTEAFDDCSVGSAVIMADLGGGTINVSSFRFASKDPVQLEETRPPQGRLLGSVKVTQAFRRYVEAKLPSLGGNSPTISHLTREFDRDAKKTFQDPSHVYYVPLNTPAHDPQFDIHSGVLHVPGSKIRDMFEPSCRGITEAIKAQLSPGSHQTNVLLVGGFAASPWLYQELKNRLADSPIQIKQAQKDGTAKAVAEGAVSYYLDRFVLGRVAEFTYGTFTTPYDPKNQKHASRKKDVYIDGGNEYLRCFTPLWKEGEILPRNAEIRQEVKCRRSIISSGAYCIEFDLTCYRGSNMDIVCEDEDPGNFRRICTIAAEPPASAFKLQFGRYYRTLTYWRVFSFVATEPTCYVEWEENTHANPPPDPRGERSTGSITHKSRKNNTTTGLRPAPQRDLLSSVETKANETLVAIVPNAGPNKTILAAQVFKGRNSPRLTETARSSDELEALEGKTGLGAKVESEDIDTGATTIVGHNNIQPPAGTVDLTSARRKRIPAEPSGGGDDAKLAQENLVLSDQNAHLVDLPDEPPTTGGGFCELYIGFYRPTGRKLAMKRPKTRFPADDILRRFRREAEIWSTLEHANIVPFFGTLEIRQSLYLVSPWMALGDLMEFGQTRSQYIKDGKLGEHAKDASIPLAYSRFNEPRIVREIASGLEYLHSSGIVHGDLKAKNVLLDAQCSAKICDFGLTKTLDHSVTSTALFGAGSVRWQSPELFESAPKSSQSDVYAFALTIVEILTGELPFPHIKMPIVIMRAVGDRHERPAFEPISQLGVDFSQLWKVAAQCWTAKPEERLTMREVLQQLGSSGADG